MTSAEIRQSFLDFFREKQHTIVPSASLLPDSPNLLFTNAGMNQFVPIFLGQQKPAWDPPRVADTQKCIRAGGKHNDLDDVGLDTYHHTFFEMLGNWSFGDYFKKEATEWAWELVVERWKLPPQRLYATVYKPGPSEPSEFDQEAHDHWARLFQKAGLDPAVHIVNGNKKDNFWMMGDTGPCGPCSELHIDLTPAGDTKGSLVNAGDPRCIEIWNLVFIQFNANADGTFSPLPQRHIDTGMGFERITSMIQGTRNFTDFSRPISNYETDVFRPTFDEIEKLSGKKYGSTLPTAAVDGFESLAKLSKYFIGKALALLDDRERKIFFSRLGLDGNPARSTTDLAVKFGVTVERIEEISADIRKKILASYFVQQNVDVAFRVIADHIRTLSFAIADGIQPSNEGRGYVLRRILRRAVRYGRTLGFHEPFFFELVDVVAQTMGDVFPEIRAKQARIRETIKREEEAFNRTLDKGIELFEREVAHLTSRVGVPPAAFGVSPDAPNIGATYTRRRRLPHFELPWAIYFITIATFNKRILSPGARTIVLNAIRHFHGKRYELFAGSVMPDHAHFLIQPLIKEENSAGENVFWPLGELMHSIKSFTAKEINKLEGTSGAVWEQERFDRFVRGDKDLAEKFLYVVENPWRANLVSTEQSYPWIWTREDVSGETPATAGGTPTLPASFAFRLYDEQGFPLDLTELMARERGLTVDKEGFLKLMDEQRTRARGAQKKTIIEFAEENISDLATTFVGYDQLQSVASVGFVRDLPPEHFITVTESPFYAEMGGQVGDTGWVHFESDKGTDTVEVLNTVRAGAAFLLRLARPIRVRQFSKGAEVTLTVDRKRRAAIQRHHTVTHVLHWALHEVVSQDAAQKGSYVGPDKLTFDFSSAALTPQQRRGVKELVNKKIAENQSVSWTEIPYAEAKKRADITQFFGDKYGDVVRVVQIGGEPERLNGYSMELCGGTHVRATGDIGSFRIVKEEAIAAGIRRIEAVAGDAARDWAKQEAGRQQEKFEALARKKDGIAALPTFAENAETDAMMEQIDARSAHLEKLEAEVHEWEKQHAKASEADLRSRAAIIANEFAATHAGEKSCIGEVSNADAKLLQAVVDALKPKFSGPIFLAGATDGRVALIASVPRELTSRFQANKLIQEVAPIVDGKGGGRPEGAQGAGKDATKIGEALARARELISL
jgi:alanyl-tRNA synthetase